MIYLHWWPRKNVIGIGLSIVVLATCEVPRPETQPEVTADEPSQLATTADVSDSVYVADSVTVSLTALSVQREDFRVIVGLQLVNLGSRDIRALRGRIRIGDVFGDHLVTLLVDHPDPLASGRSTTATYETVPSLELPFRELESLGIDNADLAVRWSLIVWPDDTRWTIISNGRFLRALTREEPTIETGLVRGR